MCVLSFGTSVALVGDRAQPVTPVQVTARVNVDRTFPAFRTVKSNALVRLSAAATATLSGVTGPNTTAGTACTVTVAVRFHAGLSAGAAMSDTVPTVPVAVLGV